LYPPRRQHSPAGPRHPGMHCPRRNGRRPDRREVLLAPGVVQMATAPMESPPLDARGREIEDGECQAVLDQRGPNPRQTGCLACLLGFGRGRGIGVGVGRVFENARGGFVAASCAATLVPQGAADCRHEIARDVRAFGGVPRGPAVEELGDHRMHRVFRAGRRGTTREDKPLELRKQPLPVGPGHGFALRLAQTSVRWLPHADRR